MGQELSRELERNQGDGGAGEQQQQQQPKSTHSSGAETRQTNPTRFTDLMSTINLGSQNVGEEMMKEEIRNQLEQLVSPLFVDAMAETLITKLFQPSSVLLPKKRKDLLVPVLAKNYYQLGEPQKTDLHVAIYTQIGPWKDAERSLPRNIKESHLRISAALCIHGDEFCNREFPFVIPPELYLKLALRTNEAHLDKFLEEFCMRVEILTVGQPAEFEPLINFEIPYNSLLNQRAILLMEKFSIKGDPMVHTLDCLVCLETEQLPVAGPSSKAIKYLRSNSREEHFLTSMCDQLKISPKLIDLAFEESRDSSKTAVSADLDEPMDFSVKKKSEVATEASSSKEVEAATEKEFHDQAIQSTPSISDAATQTSVFKIVARKHAGMPAQVYVRNKLGKLQMTSLDSAIKVAVAPVPPEPPKSFGVTKPTTITTASTKTFTAMAKLSPDASSKSEQAPKAVFVPRTTEADESHPENCFKCLETGCNQEFRNPAALRRHRKHVHSQQ